MAKMPSTPIKKPTTQTIVIVVVAGSIVLLAALWLGWDLWNRHQRPLQCGDGPRYAIDTRQFATQYSAYSLQLEASLKGKATVSLKLDPVQQEKLSEAMQGANEFRKYVVSGYNACAITKPQYAQLGARLQALDGLARQINSLATQPQPSIEQSSKLTALIDEYTTLAHKLGTD